MTALAIRKSTYDGLPRHRQTVFRVAMSNIVLGTPAVFNDGANDWYVYDDTRFTLNDASWVGVLAANLMDIPDTYHLPVIIKGGEFVIDRPTVKAEAQAFLGPSRVAPEGITYTGDNPWQETLDAQGAPAAVRMGDSVPAGWTPA
jgi:hypothetical protein